ncbi:MAG TPA: serine/threonine-protein kinase [Kofleriaceae bacterium]|nr:serine/threonine-protein kinase [Kofleriaceae bacterium]
MPANLIELAPGSIIGSYRLVREIGSGGMSTVYEAVHGVLPRRAAIKVMHPQMRRQPGMATRMVQEAAILEDLRHPGIVRIYECDLLDDGRPWIAMELVEGYTLAERLHERTVLSPAEVATLLSEVADVLASVHDRGVVHRDLKPDNLLLTPADRDFPLRVIDWGVARLGPQGRLTLDGLTPGTPIYMSPEQATGRNIAAPCDIYSLGVTAYEALAGHPPFDGRTLAEVVCMHLTTEAEPLCERCDAPEELCALVHHMLAKEPAIRPSAREIHQIARAMAQELSAAPFERSRSEAAPPPGPPSRPRRERPRPAVVPTPAAYVPFVSSDEVVIIDPEELELGTTELLPVVRRPRWTPEIGQAVASHVITPRAGCDQVAGEIVLLEKRRGA